MYAMIKGKIVFSIAMCGIWLSFGACTPVYDGIHARAFEFLDKDLSQ